MSSSCVNGLVRTSVTNVGEKCTLFDGDGEAENESMIGA